MPGGDKERGSSIGNTTIDSLWLSVRRPSLLRTLLQRHPDCSVTSSVLKSAVRDIYYPHELLEIFLDHDGSAVCEQVVIKTLDKWRKKDRYHDRREFKDHLRLIKLF